ncbi:MAG: hypothetical protein CYPHOPRED_004947 [Cyphobasidiales sp. Tagirdzhanova-0007]|nr:MAG: hypothetical protein CYPHOPRED_004947 [Cyphobasidiales sp. Tagirdzhanova-0007]
MLAGVRRELDIDAFDTIDADEAGADSGTGFRFTDTGFGVTATGFRLNDSSGEWRDGGGSGDIAVLEDLEDLGVGTNDQ